MMRNNKYLPLTETLFYILSALIRPAHGYLIMQKVEGLSNGEVRMAAGTLYGAIDNLLKQGFIANVESPDPRRKVYHITASGLQLLKLDIQRMKHMAAMADHLLEEGNHHD